MTFTGWLLLFLAIQVIHFLGTWKLYVKAGRQAWEALVPVYNAIILMKIINRPKWWTILLFLPIINLLMFPVIWIETIRSFGFTKRLDSFLVIVTLGFYLFYINYVTDAAYIEDRSLEPRSGLGEWVSSIAFAIIAATLVHTYFMQPYTIPSSSLEKSLYVGDFLLVSKFHYGARVPMTTVAAPMVHDTIPAIPVPFTKAKLTKKFKSYVFDDDVTKKKTSFWNTFQLPYMRMPGFQKIKRNDIVVFNQPADTLKDMNEFRPDRNYYKPIDKKTNLVKRCVAIAGDTLQIIDGYVYINSKRSELPERARTQYNFIVNTEGKSINNNSLVKRYGVREGGQMQDGNYYLTLTDEEAERIANNPSVKSVTKQLQAKGVAGDVFPRSANLDWNGDNYGPLYIPKKGATVQLNRETLPFYKRLISEYERNDLIVNGDEILINGKQVDSYTFKQNYYWMMGDNRQNSLDARYWGYVPFDHVVGKPVFIWLSWETNGKGLNKIRWDRMFTTVSGSGDRISYLFYFLGALALWFGYSTYKKRKNA